ncbi:MAG: ElyC/SanA/YdcF family protein [Verrucomicrobiota bacterium]
MIFIFKKIISVFLNPVSITLQLLLIGILLISISLIAPGKLRKINWLRSIRRGLAKFGLVLLVTASLFLYVCSTSFFSNALLRTVEQEYEPIPEDKDGAVQNIETPPKFIVVLPNGHRWASEKETFSRLSHTTLARLVRAVDYWNQFPDSAMIFSGNRKETDAMRLVAVRLGVPEDKILIEPKSRDTKDHAIFIKSLVGDAPFFLVTSALHMPRSMDLFKGQGLDPIPAATDYFTSEEKWDPEYDWYFRYVPRVRHLRKTDRAFHEIIGLAWARLRNQTGD